MSSSPFVGDISRLRTALASLSTSLLPSSSTYNFTDWEPSPEQLETYGHVFSALSTHLIIVEENKADGEDDSIDEPEAEELAGGSSAKHQLAS